MMKKKHLALSFFCVWLCSASGNAQVMDTTILKVTTFQTGALDYHSILADQFDFYPTLGPSLSPTSYRIQNYPAINHLPGLFCKLEYMVETKSKIAPRFRLGSLQYTEWMEGKQDFYLYNYFK